MNYYLAGYYLIKLNPNLPNYRKLDHPVWTISECINDIYPGTWGLSWSSPNKIPKDFKPTDKQLNEIHKWCDTKFDENLFLWLGSFANKAIALEFKEIFLTQVNDIHLLSLHLKEDYINAVFNDKNNYPDPKSGIGKSGLQELLEKRIIEKENGKILGFDILGLEWYGAQYHSLFACHPVEQEYNQKFGTILNEYGLIEKEEDAEKIIDYTNSDEAGVEPVLWLPFKIKLHN